MTERGKQK